MSERRWRLATMGVALALLVGGGHGCKHTSPTIAHDAEAELPLVRPDTEGLLLTWIDDKGDFHVETRVSDVPMMGRDEVRVEGANDNGANPDQIFVADLRQPRGDGAFPVRAIMRPEFEAIAVARREKTGPTLARAGPAAPSASAPPIDPPSARKPATRAVVVIYGAEWCGACHDAARYLRHKGIAYVEKDVEKDADAAREMQEKLAKRGLSGGSIPVIDVRGKVMVGFNPAEIEAALGERM